MGQEFPDSLASLQVPKMDIDEAFEAKDELSSNISAELP